MRRVAALAFAIALLAGCGGGPILANPPLSFPAPLPTLSTPKPPADPIPVLFPHDDGPHERLTEWWYYTGHLQTSSGRRFGFEAVIFRAERSSVPVAWASHLAITDEQDGTFHYAQRSEIGPQVDRSPRAADGTPLGFDLQVSGLSPALIAGGAPAVGTPWRLAGSGGVDSIEAALTPEEAEAAGTPFSLDLDLRTERPAALHDGDGFVDFGPAGTSYYYSRTRLDAVGTLQLDGEALEVEGIGWFDHQWGDFVSVGGGWDWFAITFELGGEITLSVVRDPVGEPVLVYGTLVRPDGGTTRLDADDFTVESVGTWTSPRSGRTWPSEWRITVGELVIDLEPTVLDQELDTRATTGVVYWEGSQRVRHNDPDAGAAEAYVEITRYAE